MNTSPLNNSQLPLQLLASRYGYAALLDADGNEQPITESMIRSACDEAMDTLYSTLPLRMPVQDQAEQA
jgi:hypothetical protein